MALQTSGAISLNDIHQEAGGTSGTQVSLNDTDVRGLINSTAGTSVDFNDFYGASAYEVVTNRHVISRSYDTSSTSIPTHQYNYCKCTTYASPDKTKTIVAFHHNNSSAVSSSGRGNAFVDIFIYVNGSFSIKRRVRNSGLPSAVTNSVRYYFGHYSVIPLDDKFIIIADSMAMFDSGSTSYSSFSGESAPYLHMICYDYSFTEQWRQRHEFNGVSSQVGFMIGNSDGSVTSNSGVISSTMTNTSDYRQLGHGFAEPDKNTAATPPFGEQGRWHYDGEYLYLAAYIAPILLKVDPSDGSLNQKVAFRHSSPKNHQLTTQISPAGFRIRQSGYDKDQLLACFNGSRWAIINKSNLGISHQSGSVLADGASGNQNWFVRQAPDVIDNPLTGDIIHFVRSLYTSGKTTSNYQRFVWQARNASFGTLKPYGYSRRRSMAFGVPSTENQTFAGYDATASGNANVYIAMDFGPDGSNHDSYSGVLRHAAGNSVSPPGSDVSQGNYFHRRLMARNIPDNGYATGLDNVGTEFTMVGHTYNEGSDVSYSIHINKRRVNSQYLFENMMSGFISYDMNKLLSSEQYHPFGTTSTNLDRTGYRTVAASSLTTGTAYFNNTTAPTNTTGYTTDYGGLVTATLQSSSANNLGYWAVFNDTLPVFYQGLSNTSPPALEFGTNP